jgi:hypothetical protein
MDKKDKIERGLIMCVILFIGVIIVAVMLRYMLVK